MAMSEPDVTPPTPAPEPASDAPVSDAPVSDEPASDAHGSDTPESSPPPRKRTVLRTVTMAALLIPMLAGVALWIVTRSWFLILLTAPGLEQKLGGRVEIANASYRGDGRLIYKDIIVRSRAHLGTAAKALRIGHAEIVIEPSSILKGLDIKEVELDSVLVRFSEDKRQPGQFNFGSLTPKWSAQPSEKPILPPTIRIRSAVIELGMHVGKEYQKVGHRRVSGEMSPSDEGGGWYTFQLQELDDDGASLGDDGIFVDGRWNVETLEHTARIDGLSLDERMYGMCPQMARLWWQRMDPQGPVGSAVVQWKKGEPFTAELNVDQMALTIPIATAEFSASYQQGQVESVASLPRMFVDSGTIRLEGNRLTLDNLIGEFGSSNERQDVVQMPYRVNFTIHDMPPFDWRNQPVWMEHVLNTAPFEMSVRMDNFKLSQDDTEDAPQAVQLPKPVADTLAKFNLTGWSLDTQVEITRGDPLTGPDGEAVAAPIKTVGKASITEASGAFQGFPYPLDDVSAYVEFDTERVILHYLTAKGSDEASLRISGWIAPPGKEAAISLTLNASNVPLDDRFRQGLRGGQLATFDVMLHQPSFEELIEEGLLPDEKEIDAARDARQELLVELQQLTDAGDGVDEALEKQRERLRREITRLGTIANAGPFKLGGLVDLHLDVERAPGTGTPIEITGTVEVDHAGIVYGRFPYPIHIKGGRLEIQKEKVVILDGPHGKGIPIATPGGGRGSVSGEVRLKRTPDGRRVEPALSFALAGDYLSDLLYAAMPLTDQDKQDSDIAALRPVPRRSLIARLLAGSGISGYLNHTGIITADEDGRPSFDFAVELFDATAEPNEELFETMTELGLPSPKGLTLNDVHALLQLTPQNVRLVDFTGRRGEAFITADADVNLQTDPIETKLRVDFDNLELERYMIELTPGGGKEKTAALWDRYQPQGSYDARLQYSAVAGRAELAELTIWPQELRITVDDKPVWLVCDRGDISLHDRQVSFEDFLLNVRHEDRSDGVLTLDGTYGLAGDKALGLNGSWTDGQLDSPLIIEALRLIGADAHVDRYLHYAPRGRFDADFFYESPQGDQPRQYEFAVRPATLGFTFNETPISMELDEGSEIAFRPGRIVVRDVSGRHDGGSFRLDGGIDMGDAVDADIDVAYIGRLDSPQLLAILPQNVRTAIDKLDIQSSEPVRLSQARLRLAEIDATSDEWESRFLGLLETRDASMTAGGIAFTELDGAFELDARNDPELGTSLDIGIRADRVQVLERELTLVEGQLSFDGLDRIVSVPHLRADAYGGILAGTARVGLDDDSNYDVAIDLGGVGMTGIVAPDDPAVETARQRSRPPGGEMYGSFRMSGQRGAATTRRGRGALRVAYGRMADMPVALRVLQLFELMPPVSGTLDFADVSFYIDGEHLVFEQLFLECPTLQMFGEGQMTVPGMELDLRMRTRGTLPVVRDIVAAVSDTLFLVEVTGTIKEPKAKLIPLPGVSQAPSEGAAAQAN